MQATSLNQFVERWELLKYEIRTTAIQKGKQLAQRKEKEEKNLTQSPKLWNYLRKLI